MNLFLLGSGDTDDRPALYDAEQNETVTYDGLRAAVSEFAAVFSATDSKQVVFLFCRNDVATVVAYLAGIQSGQAVALLDSRLNAELTTALINRYRPEYVIGLQSDLAGEYRQQDQGPQRQRIQRRDTATGDPAPHPELSLLLSTSGSTGSPKLVRLSQRAVEANADAIRVALGIGSGERAISSLPLHYSYGLSVLNSHLIAGAEVVLSEASLLTEDFWDVVRERECTSFAGVPYSYELLRRLDLGRLMPSTLRTLTQAGGKLADPIIEHYAKFIGERGGQFFVMYGQTEATARIAVLPADRLRHKLGSAGLPLPGGELSVQVDGVTCDTPRETGEVVYSGPNVMMGYALERQELGNGDQLQGELHTGDIGYLDKDGYLFITGRMKRIAKVFGLRLNLEEIEAMLRPTGPAAVVAAENRLIVFCEFGDDDRFAQLRQELAAKLAIHHSAFAFRRIESLPLTANGKVDYRDLETRLGTE